MNVDKRVTTGAYIRGILIVWFSCMMITLLSGSPGGGFIPLHRQDDLFQEFKITTMGRTFFADWFYKSPAWMEARKTYLDRRIQIDGGMCEDCQREPGTEVHHKEHLTRSNIHDPTVSLNPDNMILLCWDCHRARHKKRKSGGVAGRYDLDEFGNPTPPRSNSK